jgi:hypothetical protein
MPGSFAAKVLADGELAITQTAVYTVPGSTVAYVKQLFLHNVNAATQTIELWLNTSGTARKWKRLELALNESADILEDGESVQLQAGDAIEAKTTTAAVVPFTVTGVEEV